MSARTELQSLGDSEEMQIRVSFLSFEPLFALLVPDIASAWAAFVILLLFTPISAHSNSNLLTLSLFWLLITGAGGSRQPILSSELYQGALN